MIRDLVIDMSDFMEKLQEIKPWIIRSEEKPLEEGEYLQSPDELNLYRQFSMCINCMICYSACPVYGHDQSFLGPAAIALAHRYNMDSRDEGQDQRAEIIGSHEGIWECTFVGECTRVCPKHVGSRSCHPAIQGAADQGVFSLLDLAPGETMNPQKSPPEDLLYRPHMSFWWWLQQKNYFLFMVREFSAVFVGLFALISLVGVYRLSQGEDTYQLYLSALQTPSAQVLFVVILLFSLYHTLTWIHLTPMIMVVRIGSKTVPPILVLIASYLAWIVISLILFYLLMVN